MNTAKQVDELVITLKEQVANGGIPLSEAAWQTCLSCVGWSYVYSAWGAECTPSERRKRFGMCPTHTTIKTKCKAFDGGGCSGCQWYPDGQRTRCYDCRGFTDWILKQYGFDLYGDTCSAQWNHKENWLVKGEFGRDPVPQNVLVNVFIKNSSGRWTHTGFYYNGATCECSVGVQYFNPMKKNRWTHWAIAACFKNGWQIPQKNDEITQPVKEDEKVSMPTLRKGNKGDSVRKAQELLIDKGYDLGKWGADGSFGDATLAAVKKFQRDWGLTQDGVIGTKTWEMLLSAPQLKLYTVKISGLYKTQVDALKTQYPNAVVEGGE